MKTHILFFILFTIATIPIHCQNVYIPDQNFKSVLIWQGVDINDDYEISYDEASVVDYLDLSTDWTMAIVDITGIEAFVSLDTLICSENRISILDSIVGLPLKYLDCSWNQIESIEFPLPELEYLKCTENHLSQLNASYFPELRSLECNPYESLIINNPFLEELYVMSNIPINTYYAPELKRLDCEPTSPPDFSNNINLEHLGLRSYPGQIENLDLSANINLKYLYAWCNLTSLNLNNNPALTYLNLMQNDLTSLDVSSNLLLDTLICRVNELSSLDLSNNTALLYVNCEANEITDLNLSNLSNLKTLICGSNQFSEINLSDNTALLRLEIQNTQLKNIDLSTNIQLENLNCAANLMDASIDLSQNINLIHLFCAENSLQTLDLSNNILLHSVYCWENDLSILNVNGLINLNSLYCSGNKLKNIDLNTNNSLVTFQCGSNLFDSLDISHNDSLDLVSVTYMPSLTKVCVSHLPYSYTINTTGSPNVKFDVCSFTNGISIVGFENNVFPNPNTGIFTVQNPSGWKSTISIFDLNGKLIYETIMKDDIQLIDITSVLNGIYILKIVNNKNVMIRKMLKK